ncbi:formimidoylglutamase [Flavobacterium sp. NRK F10]|uniref:formimidoylglutamase n=1 Tax=Flavobacterium sp. NRK F10 TaxID=2954931 RepID=UPI002090758D|nr:formimidoylglutamase [Flavobacterium sp. NRK F10]MCO6175340.1 formimidoylglutamase [Flavobacterium sp. NRK F10]
MVFDFLRPVSDEFLNFVETLSPQTLGKKTLFNTEAEFPDLEGVQVALVTVNEYRGMVEANTDIDFTTFRKYFYGLFPGNWSLVLADLGTISPGDSIEDTYFLVRSVCEDLLRQRIIPIVIGGSQDLTYAVYRSFDALEQMVNLVTVDSKFDFAKENNPVANSYLSRIIVEEPNNLFNYANVGYQTYLNSQEEIDLIEKLYFEAYRLGQVSNTISIAEPVFRDADLVSVDMFSVQSSFSGNFNHFNPNGFDGKEICALIRYAGISDKVSTLGIFNFNNSTKEVSLVAQILWYFLEGFALRSGEYPFGTKENYFKYIVPIDDDELIFYKSDRTGRWWIEIPFISDVDNKIKKNTLLPCSHEDYLAACEQEIPERWWKAQRRNLL